jgi:hypothetical protein
LIDPAKHGGIIQAHSITDIEDDITRIPIAPGIGQKLSPINHFQRCGGNFHIATIPNGTIAHIAEGCTGIAIIVCAHKPHSIAGINDDIARIPIALGIRKELRAIADLHLTGRDLHVAPGTHPSTLNTAKNGAVIQAYAIADRNDHIARVPSTLGIGH